MIKYRYFKYKSHQKGDGTYPLMVSDIHKGYLFRENGDVNNISGNKSDCIGMVLTHHLDYYEELKPKEAIKLINKNARAKVYKFLGIPSIENSKPINLTAKIINHIIEQLTKNRAFNGDSAHKFNDETLDEILYAMTEKNLIKSLNNERYWVEL